MYVPKETIQKVISTETYDHRLIQYSHDIYAAVFRFLLQDGKESITLFEPSNEECKQKYEYMFRRY